MKLIALGSNLSSSLGAPIDHLRLAVRALEKAGFQILARAPIYQSAAVPASDQPDFLNAVVQVEFSGMPEEALQICHQIENEMGRIRSTKNEARIIDIDILAWDNLVQAGSLELPHPRLHERSFVMMPLANIAPEWIHPVLKQSAVQLKNALPKTDIRQILEVL